MKKIFLLIILSLFSLQLVNASLTDGLVSYYNGSINGGGLYVDSQSGYNGTIQGATYTADGKLDSAYYYTTNDYINLNRAWDDFIDLTGNFSFNVWYNHSGLTTNNYMIGTRESATGHGMGLESSYSGGTTYVVFQAWDGANGGITSAITTLTHKRWHMATVIRSGDNFELLIDGVSQGNTTKATFNPTVVAQVSLGRRSGNNDRYFTGVIDEVGIWGRDLSRAEVNSLYNGGVGLNPFNEGISNHAPNVPTLNSPDDSTFYDLNTISVTLNATCIDVDGDDVQALFYADTHTSPSTLVNTSGFKINNSYFTYDLSVSEGNSYYWKVKCIDNQTAESIFSSERNFTINHTVYRDPNVTLISPLNTSMNNEGFFNFTPFCYSPNGCSANLFINSTILPALDYFEPEDPFIIGWIEPTLYKSNETHHIWYAGSMANEYDIDVFTSPVNDPTNWTYLCNAINDTNFFSAGTTVVDNGTHTFMYVEADGGDSINLYMGNVTDICSYDFVDSIILATDPLMRVQVSDPTVIFDNATNSFQMYFDNIDTGSSISRNQIWYANSTNGINYSNFELVMDNNYNSWTGSRPGNPEAFLYNDYYHLVSKVDLNADNGTLGSYFAIQLIGKKGEITDWTDLEMYNDYNPFYFARAVITNEWKDDFTRPVVHNNEIYFFFTDSNSEAFDKGMTYLVANTSRWINITPPSSITNATNNAIYYNFSSQPYILPSTFAWSIRINQSDEKIFFSQNSTVIVNSSSFVGEEFVISECLPDLSNIPCNISQDLTLNGQDIYLQPQTIRSWDILLSGGAVVLDGNGSRVIKNNSVQTQFISLNVGDDLTIKNFTFNVTNSSYAQYFIGTSTADFAQRIIKIEDSFIITPWSDSIRTASNGLINLYINNSVFESSNSIYSISTHSIQSYNSKYFSNRILYSNRLYGNFIRFENNTFYSKGNNALDAFNLNTAIQGSIIFTNNKFYKNSTNSFRYDVYAEPRGYINSKINNNIFSKPISLYTKVIDFSNRIDVYDNIFNNTGDYYTGGFNTSTINTNTQIYNNTFLGDNYFRFYSSNEPLTIDEQKKIWYELEGSQKDDVKFIFQENGVQFNEFKLYDDNIVLLYKNQLMNNSQFTYVNFSDYATFDDVVKFSDTWVWVDNESMLNQPANITYNNLPQNGGYYKINRDGVLQTEGTDYVLISNTSSSLTIQVPSFSNWSLVPFSITQINILPSVLVENTNLLNGTCTASSVASPLLNYSFAWYKNGVLNNTPSPQNLVSSEQQVFTILEDSLVFGDVWTFVCNASEDTGNFVVENTSSTVVKDYQAPIFVYARLYPIIILEGEILESKALVTDGNLDNINYNFSLYNQTGFIEAKYDSVVDGEEAIVTFDYSGASSGEVIYVLVVADDGDNITSLNTSSITVRENNTAPVLFSQRVSPVSFIGTDDNIDVYCTGNDSDNDNLIYDYIWYKNNVVYKTGTEDYDGYTGFTQGVEQQMNSSILSSTTIEGDNFTFSCNVRDGLNESGYTNTTTYYIYGENNFLPVIHSVNIVPTGNQPSTTNFNLTVNASDIDTAQIQYEYRFLKNGVIQNINTTSFITPTGSDLISVLSQFQTIAGDSWYARVRAYDGNSYSNYVNSNVVTILNTAPIIDTVQITNTPYEDVNIVGFCNATDVDTEQTLTYQYKWYENDVVTANTVLILPYSVTHYPSTWVLSCRVYDGSTYSSWTNSSDIIIIDTANSPVMQSSELTGLNDDGEGLTGVCLATDDDGDRLNYSYEFFKNNVSYANGTFLNVSQNSLQSIEIVPVVNVGDIWKIKCYATDLSGDGNTDYLNSSDFEIPPINFNYVVVGTTESTIDIDWVTDATSVFVYKNNVLQVETELNGYTLEGLIPSTTYLIKLRPKKGIYYDEPVEFNVTTEMSDNNIPIMTSARISPTIVYDDIAVTGFCKGTDVNNANIFYTYEWRVNNVTKSSGLTTTYTQNTEVNIGSMLSTNYGVGDNITLLCQANDGLATSETLVANSSVQNSPPVLEEVFVTLAGAVYECDYSYTDLNDDNITSINYTWKKNNVTISTSSTVSIASFLPDDEITCGLNITNNYHSVIGTSPIYLVGDFESPVMNIVKVPVKAYTDDTSELTVTCTDNIGVANGYPIVRFINPNFIEQSYPLYHQGGSTYSRFHTFSVAGTYTNIEFDCRDGNSNSKIVPYDGAILSLIKDNVVNVGGSGGSGETIIERITDFLLAPFIQSFGITKGSTRILEFEVKNTGDTDITFTSAILRSPLNPQTYEWMSFEDGRKAVTFDINLIGGLSSDNKYVRYRVTVPDDAEVGTYRGIIEVNGNDKSEQLEVEIEVVDSQFIGLLAFLNIELFEIPFTESPTGQVIGVEGATVGAPFKVWMLLVTLVVLGALTFGYVNLRKRARG